MIWQPIIAMLAKQSRTGLGRPAALQQLSARYFIPEVVDWLKEAIRARVTAAQRRAVAYQWERICWQSSFSHAWCSFIQTAKQLGPSVRTVIWMSTSSVSQESDKRLTPYACFLNQLDQRMGILWQWPQLMLPILTPKMPLHRLPRPRARCIWMHLLPFQQLPIYVPPW